MNILCEFNQETPYFYFLHQTLSDVSNQKLRRHCGTLAVGLYPVFVYENSKGGKFCQISDNGL